MAEFLDFKEISQQIPFTDLLDYLDIPYTVKGKEIQSQQKKRRHRHPTIPAVLLKVWPK